MSRTAIYPGSFDPITNGHVDVVQRASKLFDRLIIAVAKNGQKSGLFTLDERLALIKATLADTANIEVVKFEGLLVDFADACGALAIVRGLRAISDFEYEFQMALTNRQLNPNVETIFMMPREECIYLSSSIVKEVAGLGGNVTEFVPQCVNLALSSKFAANRQANE